MSSWRETWPLLERAATRTDGGTEEEVFQTLLRGDAQLWGVFYGDEMVAAVTTQITLLRAFGASEGLPSVAPKERRREGEALRSSAGAEKGCRLWLVGGAGMAEWAADFLATVEPWARSLGCRHVWGTQSRAGWRRIVRLFGGAPVIVDGKASWMRRL